MPKSTNLDECTILTGNPKGCRSSSLEECDETCPIKKIKRIDLTEMLKHLPQCDLIGTQENPGCCDYITRCKECVVVKYRTNLQEYEEIRQQ